MLKATTAQALIDGKRFLEQHALVLDHTGSTKITLIDKLDQSIDLVDYGNATINPDIIGIQVNGGLM
ncbi:hypothetical protein VCHE48_1047 [Vibrio cholerae HE48]|uniref:hypothetical protein n=1 Tax=Vibrio cholerae TaxID=666 RepID=UPI0001BADBC4|nr:hypothetical protein [Vibrio cholerae]EEY50626.1 hypothetical protein VIH_002450 [Vibrio cholerae CT 5369-93]EGR10214.1 hypothetical protein VCHE48_1047 [Vibrio cholerae HE48]EKF9398654.1 hypothetical protein [Vibrio cholerae]